MATGLVTWAVPQLSRLLPLDSESLEQIITYADTLPKTVAAEHFGNLLGDSPAALEFITSFNSRRPRPPAEAQPAEAQPAAPAPEANRVPPRQQRQPKKKANIHNLPARQIQSNGDTAGAYRKRDETDYMASSSRPKKPQPQPQPQQQQQQRQQHQQPDLASSLQLQEKPDAVQAPRQTAGGAPRASTPKIPPSASGPLISDVLPSSRNASKPRTSSPAPAKTKVQITGGTNMHGAANTLSDLDSAIRSLELQTNPTLASNSQSAADLAKRRCNCMATRHPLLTIAPNCLSCGKIVCVKEGLGPCTHCSTPLLSSDDISSMVRVLKDERGKERQAANNSAHRRAEVSAKPRAFTGRDFLSSAAASATASPLSSAAPSDDESEAKSKAKEHRDRLLAFQAQNAKRTRIHDEAADFDIPVSGTNMWASPAERAAELKRQQKVMREMEWNARPEWEKRKVVASIDVVGGKIVKRMAEVERPSFDADAEPDEAEDQGEGYKPQDGAKAGAFSNNPLLGALIRPTVRADKGKANEEQGEQRKSTWRRVQDDNDDNEQWILDGGAYGGRTEGRRLGAEEHAFGS